VRYHHYGFSRRKALDEQLGAGDFIKWIFIILLIPKEVALQVTFSK